MELFCSLKLPSRIAVRAWTMELALAGFHAVEFYLWSLGPFVRDRLGLSSLLLSYISPYLSDDLVSD